VTFSVSTERFASAAWPLDRETGRTWFRFVEAGQFDAEEQKAIDDLQNVRMDETDDPGETRPEPRGGGGGAAARGGGGGYGRWRCGYGGGGGGRSLTDSSKTFPVPLEPEFLNSGLVLLDRLGLKIRFCFLVVNPLSPPFGGFFLWPQMPA